MKAALLGFVCGLLMPVAGLFIGLQVSPLLGNVMLFPLVLFSELTGVVFGYASGLQRMLLFLFSGGCWALLFFAASRLIKILIKARRTK